MYETLALTAPIVTIALVVSLYRSPLVGAVLVLSMAVAKAWFVELPGIELGVVLYPTDAMALLIALAALVRIIGKRSLRVPPAGLMFTALLMLSFLIGLAEFGKSAGVDFRGMFAFIVGVFYFASFDIDSDLVIRLLRVWVVAACMLMLIAWFVWIADTAGLAMAKKWIDADPTGVKFRVLASSSAYVIVIGNEHGSSSNTQHLLDGHLWVTEMMQYAELTHNIKVVGWIFQSGSISFQEIV